MFSQIRTIAKRFLANRTTIWFHLIMEVGMLKVRHAIWKWFSTHLTNMWVTITMHSPVCFQIGSQIEAFFAVITRKWRFLKLLKACINFKLLKISVIDIFFVPARSSFLIFKTWEHFLTVSKNLFYGALKKSWKKWKCKKQLRLGIENMLKNNTSFEQNLIRNLSKK